MEWFIEDEIVQLGKVLALQTYKNVYNAEFLYSHCNTYKLKQRKKIKISFNYKLLKMYEDIRVMKAKLN